MIDYAELKPFGFIPGEYEVVCQGCHQKWALMAATATHCKRCARKALLEAAAGNPQDGPGLMRNGPSTAPEDLEPEKPNHTCGQGSLCDGICVEYAAWVSRMNGGT